MAPLKYNHASPVSSSCLLNMSDFTPQHAESEGTLLVDSASDSCSLQPATSLSSLASNLSESQAPRPCLEDGREELGFGRDTEETLRCEEERSEGSLGRKVPELEVEPQETPQEERESEEKEEESLVVEDQVADFASSMLAAISCWHYRARALLFTRFTTVRLSATPLPPSLCSPHPTHHHLTQHPTTPPLHFCHPRILTCHADQSYPHHLIPDPRSFTNGTTGCACGMTLFALLTLSLQSCMMI